MSGANTVASFMASFGADLGPLNAAMDKSVTTAQARGAEVGKAFAENATKTIRGVMSRLPGGNLVGQLFGLGGEIRVGAGLGIIALVGQVGKTAVGSANDINEYRQALVGIVGDAGKAEGALSRLEAMAGKSRFKTGDILALGQDLISRAGGDVNAGLARTQNLADSAAFLKVKSENFGDFKEAFDRMAHDFGPNSPDAVRHLLDIAPGARRAVGAALGTEDPERRLAMMSGRRTAALLEQIGAANAGADSNQNNPAAVFEKAGENLRTGLAPTGDLINRALAPLAGAGKGLVDLFAGANQATGGLVGVGILAGMSALAFKLSVPPILGFIRGLTTATLALDTLAKAAVTAAVTQGEGAAAGGLTTAAGAGAAGLGGRLLAFLPLVAAAAASVGAHLLISNELNRPGAYDNTTKNIGNTAVDFALGGGLAGILSGIGGRLGQSLGEKMSGKSDKENALEENTKAIKANTKEFIDMKGSVVGGGPRARSAMSRLEIEYSLYAVRGI